MKKRIVSLLTMFCLILPCFFAVACKDKEEEPKESLAYTYSVVLKNAKGKIDENSLQTEYDYKEEKNVSWKSSDNDYSLSVTRTSALSDSLSISLLEGFDYSDLSFSVNSKAAEAEVKSGNLTGCESAAYLSDRQFRYEYSDMKKDTALVVDFSDCEWAKVSVDFTELASQGIACYKAGNEFVTNNTSVEEALDRVSETTVEVDYGTIFAFDCAQKLVFKPETSENFQDLSYAKYASKYYVGNNMIQYFKARQDGDCVVYGAVKDYENRGTLRVLDCANLAVYETLEDMQNETNALSTKVEKESYGGSNLNVNIVSETQMFMKLDVDAQNYNYYVVDSLDGFMDVGSKLQEKTLDGTSIVYLDINIAKADGSADAAKYLVRAPKSEGDYYVVYAKSLNGDILVNNADYVLIGSDNKPTSNAILPPEYDGNIFFGFLKSKDVEIKLSAYKSDDSTDFVHKQNSATISTQKYTFTGSLSNRIMEELSEIKEEVRTIECYDANDERKFYEISVDFVPNDFTDSEVTLDASDFELYDGEKVYYTTNLSDLTSWQLLTTETTLSISSQKTRTIYYYIDSNRADAFLQIKNGAGEVVSITSELRDCFGRQKTGTVTVGNDEIILSKIRYLDIKPGDYAAYTAKLLREYDKTYHTINLDGLDENTLMVSLGSYAADGSTFKNVLSLENFNIKYNGQEIGGTIYYYFNTETNKHLVLKDSEGDIVSAPITYVMETVSKPLQINGNYVYRLALVGDYYDTDEVFTLEVVDATYGLKNSVNEDVELFNTAEMTDTQEYLVEGNEYYFVGEEFKEYVIVDELTNVVVETITLVSGGSNNVYKFTFEIPESTNYVSGTTFKLVART